MVGDSVNLDPPQKKRRMDNFDLFIRDQYLFGLRRTEVYMPFGRPFIK
jgi:hypothetical protein